MLPLFIYTIPAGLSITLIFLRNSNLKKIAKNINPNYTGDINNLFDLFRLIKIYFSDQGSTKDRIFIRDTLFLVSIVWINTIIFFIYFLMQF